MKKVRFLSNVPKFLGLNAEELGPFNEGQEYLLPIDVSEMLVGRSKAAFVEAAQVQAPIEADQESEQESEPLDDSPGVFENLLNRFGNISRLIEQADTQLTPAKLGAISLVLGLGGLAVGLVARIHPAALVPVALAARTKPCSAPPQVD